ncbi:MAG: hypothetical protein J5517_07225 [Eubacterium sp.]|nr:hypothetical protein [Eubacterium sp.]
MDYETKNKITLIVIAFIVGIWIGWSIYSGGSTKSIPGGTPAPIQTETTGGTSMAIGDYDVDIKYLYEYDVDALVIHTHNYPGFDIDSKLVPKDVALAWGSVAQFNETIDFHWSQSGRWYRWKADSYDEIAPVGGVEGVNTQSANNHLIAADAVVKSQIKKIRRGDHVHLKGYLVNVDATKSNGNYFYWYSSTSREDTGDGACEVFYVTSVDFK